MNAPDPVAALRTSLPDVEFEIGTATDHPTIYVPRDAIARVCRAALETPEIRARVLVDLTVVDLWPHEPRFEIVYHLLGIETRARLRLKVRVSGADAQAPTVSGVWKAANWLEREVYDFFGIEFNGHPDLRRILMPEDWEGHPLRKDYPVQLSMKPTFAQPTELTAEQFHARIEDDRARRRTGPGGGASAS